MTLSKTLSWIKLAVFWQENQDTVRDGVDTVRRDGEAQADAVGFFQRESGAASEQQMCKHS